MLLALDPGTLSPGLALFSDTGALVAADRVRVDGHADEPDGRRWMHIGHCLAQWCLRRVPQNDQLLSVIFERPQWYSKAKSKGDPNQLAEAGRVDRTASQDVPGVPREQEEVHRVQR